jgi:protein-disulfide isomerase
MNKRSATVTLLLMGTMLTATQWYTVWTVRDLRRRVDALDPRTRSVQTPAVPKEPLSLQGAATKGSWTAPVAVLEYSDFHCPYCSTFARDTLPLVDAEYVATGKVLFAFRHLPFERLHPYAVRAARAAVCAAEQDRFWPMHDWLFQNDRGKAERQYREGASVLGLQLEPFASCMDGGAAAKVAADVASAAKLEIAGTPTFFVGTLQPDRTMIVRQRIHGAVKVDGFRRAIEEALGSGTLRGGRR